MFLFDIKIRLFLVYRAWFELVAVLFMESHYIDNNASIVLNVSFVFIFVLRNKFIVIESEYEI